MEETVTTNKPTIRNSSFELLRIIAILFIIFHHFAMHGLFDFSIYDSNSALIIINSTWIDLLSQLGKIGVNLFMLISGYFLCSRNNFKFKKLLSMVIEMVIFATIFGISLLIYKHQKPEFVNFELMLFPLGTRLWWFMTAYLILYIFSPFINRALSKTSQQLHLTLVLILLIMWSVLITFLDLNYEFNNIGWFFTLYMLASYIRKYDISLKMKPVFAILISFLIFGLAFTIRTTLIQVVKTSNAFTDRVMIWFDMVSNQHNAVQVLSTLFLFLGFKSINMKNSKVINFISASTLTIYIFHDHYFMREIIWVKLLKVNTFANSNWLILYTFACVAMVFAAGFAVYIIYKYTIGLGVNKLLDKGQEKAFSKVDRLFNGENEV